MSLHNTAVSLYLFFFLGNSEKASAFPLMGGRERKKKEKKLQKQKKAAAIFKCCWAPNLVISFLCSRKLSIEGELEA